MNASQTYRLKIHIACHHAREYAKLAGIRFATLRYSYDSRAVAARRALRRVLGGLGIPRYAQHLALSAPRDHWRDGGRSCSRYYPAGRPPSPVNHGTHAGYHRCREVEGRPCAACRAGEAKYTADRRKKWNTRPGTAEPLRTDHFKTGSRYAPQYSEARGW